MRRPSFLVLTALAGAGPLHGYGLPGFRSSHGPEVEDGLIEAFSESSRRRWFRHLLSVAGHAVGTRGQSILASMALIVRQRREPPAGTQLG